jgi:hypothetical protein
MEGVQVGEVTYMHKANWNRLDRKWEASSKASRLTIFGFHKLKELPVWSDLWNLNFHKRLFEFPSVHAERYITGTRNFVAGKEAQAGGGDGVPWAFVVMSDVFPAEPLCAAPG